MMSTEQKIADLQQQLSGLLTKQDAAASAHQQSSEALQSINSQTEALKTELAELQERLALEQSEAEISETIRKARDVADKFNSKIVELAQIYHEFFALLKEADISPVSIGNGRLNSPNDLPVVLHGGTGSRQFRLTTGGDIGNYLTNPRGFDQQQIAQLWQVFKG